MTPLAAACLSVLIDEDPLPLRDLEIVAELPGRCIDASVEQVRAALASLVAEGLAMVVPTAPTWGEGYALAPEAEERIGAMGLLAEMGG